MIYERITVTRESSDPLIKWEWRFWYHNHALILDSYVEYKRASKRHRFVVGDRYNRIDMRDSTLKESDVVLPGDVKAEALKQFCDSLTVKRWNEVKR